jgi:hypothetical protein
MRRKCTHYGCRHAEGESCNCSCGGRYHGKANVINVSVRSDAAYRVYRKEDCRTSK